MTNSVKQWFTTSEKIRNVIAQEQNNLVCIQYTFSPSTFTSCCTLPKLFEKHTHTHHTPSNHNQIQNNFFLSHLIGIWINLESKQSSEPFRSIVCKLCSDSEWCERHIRSNDAGTEEACTGENSGCSCDSRLWAEASIVWDWNERIHLHWSWADLCSTRTIGHFRQPIELLFVATFIWIQSDHWQTSTTITIICAKCSRWSIDFNWTS